MRAGDEERLARRTTICSRAPGRRGHNLSFRTLWVWPSSVTITSVWASRFQENVSYFCVYVWCSTQIRYPTSRGRTELYWYNKRSNAPVVICLSCDEIWTKSYKSWWKHSLIMWRDVCEAAALIIFTILYFPLSLIKELYIGDNYCFGICLKCVRGCDMCLWNA